MKKYILLILLAQSFGARAHPPHLQEKSATMQLIKNLTKNVVKYISYVITAQCMSTVCHEAGHALINTLLGGGPSSIFIGGQPFIKNNQACVAILASLGKNFHIIGPNIETGFMMPTLPLSGTAAALMALAGPVGGLLGLYAHYKIYNKAVEKKIINPLPPYLDSIPSTYFALGNIIQLYPTIQEVEIRDSKIELGILERWGKTVVLVKDLPQKAYSCSDGYQILKKLSSSTTPK